MYARAANPGIASEYGNFTPYLTVSGILHGALMVLLALSAYFHWNTGNRWAGVGGGGENVKVTLVGSAGIPMPRPKIAESQVVDPTKSLYKPEEAPKLPDPTPAEKIPEFKHEKPLPPVHKSKVFENPQPPPPNAVPGHGGAPAIPTGVADKPGSTTGLEVKGEGGGDFASRYGWYVDSVKRRIQTNWLQNTIDPAVRQAHVAHAVAEFTISKDGSVKDIRIVQTSGNASMDNSSLRALMSSNPMPALPPDYGKSYVTVTFDFDLSMTR
jgi:periplasmic protein TonB